MGERILPTPEQLRELLRYEPETGKLFWKERPRSMFCSQGAFKSWNSKYSGEEAFTFVRKNDGYRQGSVNNISLLAHRVVWALVNGLWPEQLIDHVSGHRCDNRISNLRQASQSENLKNRPRQKNNASGFKGVYQRYDTGKWAAAIWSGGMEIKLGSRFATPEEAHAAYCAAAQEHHGKFARTE